MSLRVDKELQLDQRTQVVRRMQNKSGYEVWPGDVVVIDTTNSTPTNLCFTLSNTADDVAVYGEVLQQIANAAYGRVLTEGPFDSLKADGNTNIAAGNVLAVIDGTTYPDYATGDVAVNAAGATVTGNGTTFTAAMKGRKIYFGSEVLTYRITAVGSGTSLTISPPYRGAANITGSAYNITAKGIAMKATAGKGGAFAVSLEAYTTDDSYGVLDAVLFKPPRIDSTAAGTLDSAYDYGGSGSGRAITVDSDAVALTNNAANNNGVLTVGKSPVGAQSGDLVTLTVGASATGAALVFANSGSGNDMTGSGTWSITKAGAAVFGTLTATAITLANATAPAGTVAYVAQDNSGDVNINALNTKTIELRVAGTNVITIAGAAITLAQATTISTGGLTVGAGGITVTGTSSITGDTTITGALTVSGALNWGGATTIGATLTVDELVLDTDGAALLATQCGLWRDNTGDASLQAIAGKEVKILIALTCEMQVGDAATIVNEGSNDRDFRVESANLQYALYVDGAKDSIVIGDDTDVSDVDIRLRVGNVAKTLAANQSAALLWVAPTAATTESGGGGETHASISTAYFAEPNITHAGTSAITMAATVYIANAPTEGAANAALYVASGAVTLDGGAFTFNEASADVDFRIESNGLQYALYVDGGKDCVVVGDDTDISDVDYRLMVGNVAKTLADNQSASILYVAPTGATTESGTGATTHAYISTAYFSEPIITHAGTSAITVAATVYIASAPTEGTANAALYIASGALTIAAGAVTIDGGAFLFNEASADLDFRVESNTLQYALYVDGLKDAVVIGGDTDVSDADTSLRISSVAKTITNNENFAILWVAPVGSTTFQGTNAIVATAYFKEPDLTDPGAGSATIASTVYIADAPTEGDANYALYIAVGASLVQAISTGAITVTGGQVIKASSATEIGITVDNSALTVGSAGSIKVPYLSSIGAAFSDAIGGDQDGCIGVNLDTDAGPTATLEARVNSSWLSVALAGLEIQGRTVGGSTKRGEKWHANQIIGDGVVDETICFICGKKMKVGEPIVLCANYERKGANGSTNLHAVYAHHSCAA